MGFDAVASTSAGFGRSIGKDDYLITRDELVTHVGGLRCVLSLPLNVDSEQLFPNDPGGIAETVRLLREAGAVDCSIEDYHPKAQAIASIEDATDAVNEASEAFLRRLPRIRLYESSVGRVMLCHGVGEDDEAWLRPDTRGYALQDIPTLRELMLDGMRITGARHCEKGSIWQFDFRGTDIVSGTYLGIPDGVTARG